MVDRFNISFCIITNCFFKHVFTAPYRCGLFGARVFSSLFRNKAGVSCLVFLFLYELKGSFLLLHVTFGLHSNQAEISSSAPYWKKNTVYIMELLKL